MTSGYCATTGVASGEALRGPSLGNISLREGSDGIPVREHVPEGMKLYGRPTLSLGNGLLEA